MQAKIASSVCWFKNHLPCQSDDPLPRVFFFLRLRVESCCCSWGVSTESSHGRRVGRRRRAKLAVCLLVWGIFSRNTMKDGLTCAHGYPENRFMQEDWS